MNIEEIKKELARIAPSISRIAEAIEDIEQNTVSESLSNIGWQAAYLSKPITAEGILHKNSAGRFQIDEDHYFTSGSTIEVLIYDDLKEQVAFQSNTQGFAKQM